MNRKKIVITGASGFLGSHLVERIKNNKEYRVFAVSSRPDEIREKIGGKHVEYLYKDAVMGNHAPEVLEDAIVISCAYPRNSSGTTVADGLNYIQRVFESAVENKAAAIINISSQSVYSQQRLDVATEETPVCLETPYAVGKYAVELMLESICKGTETKYTSLRMASLIGPGFNQRIVNRLALKIMNHEPISLVRQPKKMGFLDVEDAVSAIMSVADLSLESWKTVYNIGNGLGYTVEEIYNVVAAMMKNKIEFSEPSIVDGSDISSTAVSFERLHEDTGFTPEIDLNESVKRIIALL